MIEFKKINNKFNGNYRGKVLDNDDPDLLGRIKVEIYGVLDDIAFANLPWATPAMPIFSGAGNGFGCFCVPEVDSYVWCFFEAGDFYQPVYFAEALDAVHGLPSERITDYPNGRVLKTKNGIVLIIDDKSGNEHIQITHPTGATIKIDSAGNITISGTIVRINP